MDRLFWEKAYTRYAPGMKGICRRYVGDNDLAEDIVQDAFLEAITHCAQYTGKGSIEAWLRKIAVNQSLMHLRKQNSRKVREAVFMYQSNDETPEEESETGMRQIIEDADFSDEELLSAIDNLPEHHKLVFNLYVIDKFSHAEIASELQISPGTSKSHLARARKKIRQILLAKAAERQKEQKKRAGLWLFFISDSKIIDRLYKKRFSKFQPGLSTSENPAFRTIQWDKVSAPAFRTPGIPYQKWWFWMTGVVIILIATWLLSPKEATEPVSLPKLQSSADTLSRSTPSSDSTASTPPEIKQTSGTVNVTPPVVVKKSIIEHRTVTVHDTVRVNETTNAK